MSELINYIYYKAHATKVILRADKSIYAENSSEPIKTVVEHLDVKLIVMSHESHKEVMRQDYNNTTGACRREDITQPYRVFGIRVAFDDSLPFGKVLVAGELYD